MVLPPVPLRGARALLELEGVELDESLSGRLVLVPVGALFLAVDPVVLVFLLEEVRDVALVPVELRGVVEVVFLVVRLGLGRLPRQLLPPNLDTIRRFRCYCCL